jgi:hypothetical protein
LYEDEPGLIDVVAEARRAVRRGRFHRSPI